MALPLYLLYKPRQNIVYFSAEFISEDAMDITTGRSTRGIVPIRCADGTSGRAVQVAAEYSYGFLTVHVAVLGSKPAGACHDAQTV